jgi:hypothetical protein
VSSSRCSRRPRSDAIATIFQQLESLEEYVLVSQDERRIEVRRRDGRNWHSETRGPGESFTVHGREMAVDALYD